MKETWKKWVHAIIFVGVFLLLLTGVSVFLSPKNNTRRDGMKNQEANGILTEPEDTVDVLMLGDSESYSSMSPLQIWHDYGVSSYCCGTDSQKLYDTEEFLRKAFAQQSPNIVILETGTLFRNFSFAEAVLHRASTWFPVFAYHNRWKSLRWKDLKLDINYTNVESTKGYHFTVDVEAASDEGYMKADSGLAPISAWNRGCVESIQAFCEEYDAQLILMSAPSTVNWNMQRHNSVQKMADELGVEYVDMNLMREEIPIDWSRDTRDGGDHLNYYGATKVSAWLGKYLSETKRMPDHRGDGRFASWNSYYENLQEKAEDAAVKS